MAILVTNAAAISSGSELQLPGEPLAFGLRSAAGFIRPYTLYAEMGTTSLIGHLFTDPRLDSKLNSYATVSYRAPERVLSGAEKTVGTTLGFDGICDITASGSDQDAGIFEISVPIKNYYLPVMASVTFAMPDSLLSGGESPYWASLNNVAPMYFGLEFGIKNTGIFGYLRDDGAAGSMVVGGPITAYRTPRPNQEEIPAASWMDAALNNGFFTVFFLIDPESQLVRIWKRGYWGINNADGDQAPVAIGAPIPIDRLGQFLPSTSSLPQNREGASPTLTLFFGHGGATGTVSIADFSLYRFYSPSVFRGVAYNRHSFSQVPNLPLIYRSSDSRLPTDHILGRWTAAGTELPTSTFWYQPGKKSSPLYTAVTKADTGTSFLYREEPNLSLSAAHDEGFSVEAWMGGDSTTGLVDRGFGIKVSDGTYNYRVTAIKESDTRTYGLERKGAVPSALEPNYYVPRLGGVRTDDPLYAGSSIIEADYTGLRLIRMTYDRNNQEMLLFIEDPDSPVLIVPTDSGTFPAPDPAEPASVSIGHFVNTVASGNLNLAASSLMPNYLAWEKWHGLPDSGPSSKFTWSGAAAISPSPSATSSMGITGKGISTWNNLGNFAYSRGFQVDFKAIITSEVPDESWTGVGVTVYLGTEGSAIAKKLHVGFFDCGISGRKVGIVTADSLNDIIHQTPRGRKYSADWDWGTTSDVSSRSLRLVYRPYKSVELWGPTLLKAPPLITIPWNEFEAEQDSSSHSGGLSFGLFNPDINVVSEWDYVRWGVGAGIEATMAQDIVDISDAQDGRLFTKISASELLIYI